MRKLLDKAAFSVGGDEFRWRDVILAAMGSGEWRLAETATRRGLVAAGHARASGMTIPKAAIDEAARKFRYARGLTSGLATEVWLARWDLDAAEWTESIRRTLLHDRLRDVLRGLTHAGALDRESVQAAMHADAVCASLYDRLARTLSARVVAHARLAGGPMNTSAESRPFSTSEFEKAVARVDLDLLGITADEARQRLGHFSSLQGSVDQFHRLLVTDARVREWIDARALEWTRFDCRLGIFADRDAASEALLCVRDDGRDLADVTTAARAALMEKRFFLDEAEPAARDLLRGARAGNVIGPVHVGDDWVIFDVRDKRLPVGTDPAVRRRAEREVLADAVDREIERSVRWTAA